MNQEFFKNNRNNLMSKLPNNAIAIISSGSLKCSTGDSEYEFEVFRNFYYFTGINFHSMKLILVKQSGSQSSLLSIPKVDYNKVKWTGDIPSGEQCLQLSGVDRVVYNEEFDDLIHSYLSNGKIDKLYLYSDFIQKNMPQTENNLLLHDFRLRYPSIKIEDLSLFTLIMRAKKSECEIDEIVKAQDITKSAIEAVYKIVKPGMNEYEIQAEFEYNVKKRGSKLAFSTICASGDHGHILHYIENNKVLEDGSLLLLDCGACVNMYNSDVTRTFPVNGKFTPRQRQIYEIVLEANKMIIAQIKPGMTCVDLNNLVIEFYNKKLVEIGLIEEGGNCLDYYYHGVSHSLGLDVHDVFERNMPLAEGMIITVEPGLYIAQECIGIRIEDDILVTNNGAVVLTKDIVKEIDEIENLILNK